MIARLDCPASSAGRDMVRRALILSALYLAAMAAGVWAIKNFALEGPILYGIAVVIALPLLGCLLAIGRYVVEERDEYLRMMFVRAMVTATGLLLAVSAAWGVLEVVADAPALPIYYGLAIWCIGLGVGRLLDRSAR